jgi:hypothetical protein
MRVKRIPRSAGFRDTPVWVWPPQAPFSYEALPPEDIRFVPLKQTREFNAKELMQVRSPVTRSAWCAAGSTRADRLNAGCDL